jgi:tetratricopeptide (TPR) repeat protein
LKRIILITFIFIGLLFASCSQESNGRFSKAYHNTTARFNAYFLAKEKMKEIEAAVLQKTENDYNKILDLYPTYDTNFAKTLRPMFDECIKKSSLVIQWHKNSKWLDNSYILIGRCRLYALDYTNAAGTFKYINAKGTDENDKHEALILLMRTYIETKDFVNAQLVKEYLESELLGEKLNNDNIRDYALTKALLHQIFGEYEKEAEQLEIALPKIKVKDQKSRVLFILAQIYQLYGQDEKSHEKYQLVLKNNPTYELSFFTKLYMAQVTSLSSNSDTKKIYKYFKKLLKDEKNKEYKDKMYYEMGKFELKQNNIPKGLEYLNLSVQEDLSPVQKAYSYLKIGEVYYEKMKNFKTAQLYYDSCLATLPKNNIKYNDIKKRALILNEFVEQFTIVQLQDSLLKLSKLSKPDIDVFLDKYIADDIVKQKEKYEADIKRKKLKEEKKEENIASNNTPVFGDGSTKWYFYNAQTLASSKIEFAKKWGQRTLEDDWRRSSKANSTNDNEEVVNDKKEDKDKKTAKEEFKPIPLDKDKLFKTIPFDEESRDSATYKSAEASFKLGRIYKTKLKEKENAFETYNNHLTKYPDNKRHVEVMYTLYLMYNEYKDKENELKMKERILNEFPNSMYAKLIKNPNFLVENKQINEQVKNNYRSIFLQYEANNYGIADTMINEALIQYPENEIEDKYILLKAIIKGKQKKYPEYKIALNEFIENYKSSASIKYAKQLLEGINSYKAPEQNSIEKPQNLINDTITNQTNKNDSTNVLNVNKTEKTNSNTDSNKETNIPASSNKEAIIEEKK